MWQMTLRWLRVAGQVVIGLLVLAGLFLAAAVQSLPELAHYGYFDPRDWRPRPPLETQLQDTLKALDTNSKDALTLIERLRAEVAARIEVMKDSEQQLALLRQQRTLLALTPQQQAALDALARRPVSPWNVVTSWEFVFNGLVNVAVAGLFYWLGIRRGRRYRSPA